MLNVTVHNSRNRLKRYGLFGRIARRKRLLSEKNMAAWLRSAKLHLNKPQNLNNVNGHNAKHWSLEKTFTIFASYRLSAEWRRADFWGFFFFCTNRNLAPCSYQLYHEILCIPKHSRVRRKAICPTAKSWTSLGHIRGQ